MNQVNLRHASRTLGPEQTPKCLRFKPPPLLMAFRHIPRQSSDSHPCTCFSSGFSLLSIRRPFTTSSQALRSRWRTARTRTEGKWTRDFRKTWILSGCLAEQLARYMPLARSRRYLLFAAPHTPPRRPHEPRRVYRTSHDCFPWPLPRSHFCPYPRRTAQRTRTSRKARNAQKSSSMSRTSTSNAWMYVACIVLSVERAP